MAKPDNDLAALVDFLLERTTDLTIRTHALQTIVEGRCGVSRAEVDALAAKLRALWERSNQAATDQHAQAAHAERLRRLLESTEGTEH